MDQWPLSTYASRRAKAVLVEAFRRSAGWWYSRQDVGALVIEAGTKDWAETQRSERGDEG